MIGSFFVPASEKLSTNRGAISRRHILENGVGSLRVYKTKVVQHVYGAIQEYAGFDNPEWLF